MTPRTISADEAIEILHNFLPLAVNGEINPEVVEIIEQTVSDIAEGHDIYVKEGPLLDIVKIFFACFDFDDEEGTYCFQRDNYVARGETGPGLMKI